MIGQQKNNRTLYHQNYNLIEKNCSHFSKSRCISELPWNFLKNTNAQVLLFSSRVPDMFLFLFFFFQFKFIYFNWRIITLQYCIGFAIHQYESAMGTHVFPILNPLPPLSPYHFSGSFQWTIPENPVSCIEPELVICFTYDIIHVSMPFSQIIPPSPSPTESKRLFYTCVSFFAISHTGLSLPSF